MSQGQMMQGLQENKLEFYSMHEEKPPECLAQETDMIRFLFLKDSACSFERISLWGIAVKVLQRNRTKRR